MVLEVGKAGNLMEMSDKKKIHAQRIYLGVVGICPAVGINS